MDWVLAQGWTSRNTPATSSTSASPTVGYHDVDSETRPEERKNKVRASHTNATHGRAPGASATDGIHGHTTSNKAKQASLHYNRLLSSRRSSVPIPVILNIYHLGQNVLTRAFNAITRNGAYHSGLEIGGKEWSYGMTLDDYSTGVTWNAPKMHPDHTFRESLFLGNTKFSKGEIFLMLEELKRRWLGRRYNVWTRNCHHFSTEFCRLLGVGRPPDWLNKLATQGKSMHVAFESESTEFDGGAAVVDFFSSITGAIRNFFSFDDADHVEDERNRRQRIRLSPPVLPRNVTEQTRSSTAYDAPLRSQALWENSQAERQRTHKGFANDSARYRGELRREEWQNKWHNKRRGFDAEEMDSDASDSAWGDELDALARCTTRQDSATWRIAHGGRTRASEGDGGLRGDVNGYSTKYANDDVYPGLTDYDHQDTAESQTYSSNWIPRTANHHVPQIAHNIPPAGSRNRGGSTVWDALWPSPKEVEWRRSASGEHTRLNRGREGSISEGNGNAKASVYLRTNNHGG